ncbi:MAG: urate hydroxylase PuuD [Acidiferrobacterales bacterium]
MDLILDRWLHILAGITWIGLLYYFNFVQVPAMGKAKADGIAADIVPKLIAPKALFWFRYAALATWVTGAYYLMAAPHLSFADAFMLKGASALIGIGAWLGTIMFFNVWVLIWPNQQKVLGLKKASAEEKASAARIALLASRTNTLLSIPMVFFMVVGPHGLPM